MEQRGWKKIKVVKERDEKDIKKNEQRIEEKWNGYMPKKKR